MSFSFNKTHRLRKPSQYRRVFQSPVRIADSTLLLLARRNNDKIARLGLALAKKNINSAVERNRLKRLLRESFRQHKDLLQGWDIVVLAHRKLNSVQNKKINDSIHHHWRKLQQCKDS